MFVQFKGFFKITLSVLVGFVNNTMSELMDFKDFENWLLSDL